LSAKAPEFSFANGLIAWKLLQTPFWSWLACRSRTDSDKQVLL